MRCVRRCRAAYSRPDPAAHRSSRAPHHSVGPAPQRGPHCTRRNRTQHHPNAASRPHTHTRTNPDHDPDPDPDPNSCAHSTAGSAEPNPKPCSQPYPCPYPHAGASRRDRSDADSRHRDRDPHQGARCYSDTLHRITTAVGPQAAAAIPARCDLFRDDSMRGCSLRQCLACARLGCCFPASASRVSAASA